MSDLRLDERSMARLAAATARNDPVAVADAVAGTDARWFDGLDPATAWALVWIEATPQQVGLDELVGLTVRFGYRHGRLLFRSHEHPSYSDPATTDVLAGMVLELASQLAPSDRFGHLPTGVAACHRVLAEHAAQAAADQLLPIPAARLTPVLLVTLDLGFALSVVEEHLFRRHWLVSHTFG
jgi:hypothetical protein